MLLATTANNLCIRAADKQDESSSYLLHLLVYFKMHYNICILISKRIKHNQHYHSSQDTN